MRGWILALALCGCGLQKLSSYRFEGKVPDDSSGFSNALYQAAGVKLAGGNRVEEANNGEFFDLLVKDIETAKRSIDIVVFIWKPGAPSDRLAPAVAARAKEGVECRILVDAMGSPGFPEEIQPGLEQAGCKVHLARDELTLSRNHRKIFIIDGRVGYTGGVGIGNEWLEWRDSNVRITGPAVEQLERAFAENWIDETGTLVPASHFAEVERQGDMQAAFVSSAKAGKITQAERLTHLAIAAAQKRLWVGNAYFVPSPGLLELIEEKARSGVDVRFIVPGKGTDHPEVRFMQQRYYQALLGAGVQVYEYQPAMYHSKVMIIDDHIAMVGSINLDKLSQDLLDEGTLVVFDGAFTKQLEKTWLADETNCVAVQP
ncbi:MAG: Cardiolipin synthetase [Myxococcaceae bacterium]|nr:Cardiolipin synthetase [Myxococcaceae bacterium]